MRWYEEIILFFYNKVKEWDHVRIINMELPICAKTVSDYNVISI